MQWSIFAIDMASRNTEIIHIDDIYIHSTIQYSLFLPIICYFLSFSETKTTNADHTAGVTEIKEGAIGK